MSSDYSPERLQHLLTVKALKERKAELQNAVLNFSKAFNITGTTMMVGVEIKNPDGSVTSFEVSLSKVLYSAIDQALDNERNRIQEQALNDFLKKFEAFAQQIAYLEQNFEG